MSLVRSVVSTISGLSGTTSPSYVRSNVLYDYAIGDLPFLAATSKEAPYRRTSAQIRKQQFDSSPNPGEQSLDTGWWLRSQSSFHRGAGLRFLEPASDDEVMTRFRDSVGIDPWTPGEVSLLRRMVGVVGTSSEIVLVEGAIDGTTDIYLHADDSVLVRRDESSNTTVTWGGANVILSICQDGDNYYAADDVGIYKGTLAGGAGSKIWDTGDSDVVIGWAKQRLVAGIGPSMYELVSGGPTLPTPLYTHPTATWKWTGITEGPSAIFAAGYAGATSAIYKFVLSTAGVMPTLTSGVVACNLPVGEVVHSIYSYLGAFMAVGTNKGVRIGVIAENGDITLGPLTIESTQPVYDLVGQDRFIYATCTDQIDGQSGLWRIDLGRQFEDGRFAYATDLHFADTGRVSSVTMFGASGRLVIGMDGGSKREHATELEASGWFRTGFIRYNTVEPKFFKYVRLKSSDLGGSLTISTVGFDDDEQTVFTLDETVDQGGDIPLARAEAEEFLGLKFTLNRNSADATMGASMNSYQVKALPAIKRPRIIKVPVLLFQEMKDKKGTRLPPQNPEDVLALMEEMETSSDTYLFKNICTNRSELVTIEEIDFINTAPPAPYCKGEGGIAYITLRTVQ